MVLTNVSDTHTNVVANQRDSKMDELSRIDWLELFINGTNNGESPLPLNLYTNMHPGRIFCISQQERTVAAMAEGFLESGLDPVLTNFSSPIQ